MGVVQWGRGGDLLTLFVPLEGLSISNVKKGKPPNTSFSFFFFTMTPFPDL